MKIHIKSYVLIIISIICWALFYEFYLRFTEMALPSFVYDDPKYGRTFKPGSQILFVGAEGFYMGQVNPYGYIGKGYPERKQDNVLRVAIFGDSFIEGLQLFERNHFRTLVENKLSKRLNKKVEILNFGIGGTDFSDMYFIYQSRGKFYNPDIVLFKIKRPNLRNRGTNPNPKYYLDHDSLKVTYDYMKSEESHLRKQFALIRQYSIGYLLKEAYENYNNGLLAKNVFEKFYNDTITDSILQMRKLPESPEKDKQFPVNKKILRELNTLASNGKTKCILFIADDFPQYYYSVIDSLESVTCLKIPHELNDYNSKEFRFWKASGMYGHWNQKAHSVVSEILTDAIFKLIDNNEFILQTSSRQSGE